MKKRILVDFTPFEEKSLQRAALKNGMKRKSFIECAAIEAAAKGKPLKRIAR